jgi:hypothetical protein
MKRKNHRILQESTGNSRKWKQYSDRKFVGFFSGRFQSISGALHEIAAGRKISDDLPIVKNYLYSISMMVKIRLIN